MEQTKTAEGPAREMGAPKVDSLDEIEKQAKRPKLKKGKRPRAGRPTLEEQAAKEAEEKTEVEAMLALDTSAVRGMLEWIFGSLLAPRFGSHWKLKSDEAEAGGQAWGAVLNKYSPAASAFIEEIRAGMWTVGTTGPRWQKTQEILAAQAAAAEAVAIMKAGPEPEAKLTKAQEKHNVQARAKSGVDTPQKS